MPTSKIAEAADKAPAERGCKRVHLRLMAANIDPHGVWVKGLEVYHAIGVGSGGHGAPLVVEVFFVVCGSFAATSLIFDVLGLAA